MERIIDESNFNGTMGRVLLTNIPVAHEDSPVWLMWLLMTVLLR